MASERKVFGGKQEEAPRMFRGKNPSGIAVSLSCQRTHDHPIRIWMLILSGKERVPLAIAIATGPFKVS